MARIWVERDSGLDAEKPWSRWVDGCSHEVDDLTDRPCQTITSRPRFRIFVEPEQTDMKVMVESAAGHSRAKTVKLDGRAHEFRDVTDEPAETVTLRRVVMALDPSAPSSVVVPPPDGRPPYYVPSLDEIRALPDCGLRVCSLFAGTGGSSLGYRMAGFRVLYANEFIEAARDSYRANMAAGTIIDERDIRHIEPGDILEQIGLKRGELDVLDGSPPCSSFSTAGIKEKGWNKVKTYSDGAQRSDDLFYEYIRILEGVMPKVFVAENVSGLIKGVAKGYFLDVLKKMKAVGYTVEARVLDAQWLGVPQRRRRVIFMGVRKDLGRLPVFPKPLAYRYTLRDALPWLSGFSTFKDGPQVSDLPAPTLLTHGRQSTRSEFVAVEPEADMSRFEVGKEWAKMIPDGNGSDRFFSLFRPALDAPIPTVTAEGGTASLASVTHPLECRKFSIAELRRVCGFPDDFVLTGTYAQQWERLGRAVPPVMMRHIATQIRDNILCSTS